MMDINFKVIDDDGIQLCDLYLLLSTVRFISVMLSRFCIFKVSLSLDQGEMKSCSKKLSRI